MSDRQNQDDMLEDQVQKAFWDWSDDGQGNRDNHLLPQMPTEHEIRQQLKGPWICPMGLPDELTGNDCPLNEIVVSKKNEGAMRTLRSFAFTAYKRFNHCCRGLNFLLTAESGQGKTYWVKQYAKTIGLPFAFIQSDALGDTWTLFQMMRDACEELRLPIVPQRNENDFSMPPMIVFFDEVHALAKRLMQGGLLNAMEHDDGWMTAKLPGSKGATATIDCYNVCWIGATTERGLLFDALENRLGTHIHLHPAGPKEVAKIIKRKMESELENGEIPFMISDKAAAMVAKYQTVPREALNFARRVIHRKDMMEDSWEDSVESIRKDMGLDDWGLDRKQLAVITALGKRPIAKSNLHTVANCRTEEVQRYVLPLLMSYSGAGPMLVPTKKGMALTRHGLKELDKRGISHKGESITAEAIESR